METQEILSDTKLRFSTPEMPGYFRQVAGSNFKYYDDDGHVVKDPKIILRITNLTIPPALRKVWICKYPNGHLQATGIDKRGRKQYFYHKDWIQASQMQKFERLSEFAETLPLIRKKIRQDMNRRGLTKEKVVATIVWLLQNTLIRIGNVEYEKENKSYGLTTLKRRHAKVRKDTITFQFKGKSGVYHDVDIENERVAQIVKECQELPGQQLFEYLDAENKRQAVTSDDINEYLQHITGKDITAKDFRTWAATVIAAKLCDKVGVGSEEKEVKKKISGVVKEVAKHLRNLPATCRKYYIHPTVFRSYSQGYVLSNITSYKRYKEHYHIAELNHTENTICNMLTSFS